MKIMFSTITGSEGIVTQLPDGSLQGENEFAQRIVDEHMNYGDTPEEFMAKYSDYFSGHMSAHLMTEDDEGPQTSDNT